MLHILSDNVSNSFCSYSFTYSLDFTKIANFSIDQLIRFWLPTYNLP